MKTTKIFSALVAAGLVFSSCNDENNSTVVEQTTTFKVTLKNVINYLSVKKIGDDMPLKTAGAYFETKFKATKGTYLSFANMFAQSNDWFFATRPTGIKLWDGDTPKTGDISNYINVWDAGTETDEAFLTDFPNTKYTAPNQSAPNTGPADSDPNVRDTGRDIRNYLTASLAYDASTRYFTLKIVKVDRSSLHNPGFVTPGVLVVHTLPNALFEAGKPVRKNGLESLAEDGNPKALYDWFNEKGSLGAPLRLSSSYTPFSPGVAYAFSSSKDPLFTQGEAVKANSGVKELAESGTNQAAYDYLKGENITVAKSEQPGGVAPGSELTFTIQAKPGDKLGFATMFVKSNDWIISYNNNGVELFDGTTPRTGELESVNTYLFDVGTEKDETIGFGEYQPMGTKGSMSAGPDTNTTIRRVAEIDDVQFGKGEIKSAPGVTAGGDPRGGYNLIKVYVTPQ